ncbi:hypothetical protein D9M68_889980 [compost metagenome]
MGESRFIRIIDIAVEPPQEIQQGFYLLRREVREQPPFPLKGYFKNSVVQLEALGSKA